MLRKKSIFIFLISVIFTFKINYLFAAGFPNLKLPFQKGESWGITTGYGGSSYHQNKNYYAIDFNLAGAADLGKPILAAANGNVIFADWDTTGFGWCVIIDHGDKYKTLYAHFMEKPTVSGQVQQGQEIGVEQVLDPTCILPFILIIRHANQNQCLALKILLKINGILPIII